MLTKIIALFSVLIALFIVTILFWIFTPMVADTQKITLTGDARNGAYLARMSGCIACHSDPDSGNGALAGGPPLISDFGTFAAPNITQDVEHGIGDWTIDQFSVAVRQGVSPEGEPYYPAFPYEFFNAFSDQDIADLWAAFQTVPAINTADPVQKIPFPFNIRSSLKGWQTVFSQPVQFSPDDKQSDAYNRGGFIVEGPAHCAACHTPRNFAGALQIEKALHGSDNLPDNEVVPAIDAASLIEKGWTVDDLGYALQTGMTPEGDSLGGSMGEVILGGTQYLRKDDLAAMAEYLLTEKKQ